MTATETQITNLANQVPRDAIAVSEDKIRVQEQAALVLAHKDQIKQAASVILKREKLIEVAEARLQDQAEALTIRSTAINAKFTVTQKMLTNIEEHTEKVDVVICSIMSLQTTEKVVQSVFSCMRKYADSLQHNLATPPQAWTVNEDFTAIQTKLAKMEQFANRSMDKVRKVGKHQIAAIKESTGSIFLKQNSVYHKRIKTIKDAYTAALDE